MFYRIIWFIGALPLSLLYRLKVVGRKNFLKKGRCVGICNHYTLLDVPAVSARFFRRFFYLSKKEFFRKGTFSNWLFRKLGAIPLDRDHPDLNAMKESLKALKDEKLLMLFPEGTRNKDGTEVQDVKAGAAVFAIKGKAPIIPMAMYRPPKPFRKNYLMVGEPFTLEEFYGKRLTQEEMARAGEIIFERMTKVKSDVDAYAFSKMSKRKQRKFLERKAEREKQELENAEQEQSDVQLEDTEQEQGSIELENREDTDKKVEESGEDV